MMNNRISQKYIHIDRGMIDETTCSDQMDDQSRNEHFFNQLYFPNK